jgi:hypothetical protein
VKKEEVERGKGSYNTSVGRDVDGYRYRRWSWRERRPSPESDDSPALACLLATGDWRLASGPRSVACTLNLERNLRAGVRSNARGRWRGLERFWNLLPAFHLLQPSRSLLLPARFSWGLPGRAKGTEYSNCMGGMEPSRALCELACGATACTDGGALWPLSLVGRALPAGSTSAAIAISGSGVRTHVK